MLNSTTKNRINTCRDILVGKIPDPKGQIDQITNALVYKFMDDQDRMSRELDYNAQFFTDDYEKYAWSKLFDTKLTNQDRANLYIEGLDRLSRADHLPDLFKQIFKDAYLPFRDANTIVMFLTEINGFDYHHSEELGNAFEYLLSIMGSQGDAGQFRTPRHIIEFLVDVVDPQKSETILDPACGTAGFLVEAFKHISAKGDIGVQDIAKLAESITGVDIDPGMAKIARVNLYLHGFKTPKITENDTLTNEKLWGTKYDVILANPPFMTPKGGIQPHDKFAIRANRAEVLFTDYIAEHLRLHGRAGIIVPEGIIFQGSNAYKDLRKMLVDDGYLWAVVSLPAGCFNPYSGVKTTILFLDRERAKKTDKVLFVKIKEDGYDLGAQRRPIEKNDLPKALEILNKYKENPGIDLENEPLAHLVEKSKIAKSGDYNLSGDRYITSIASQNSVFDTIEIGKICQINPESVIPLELYGNTEFIYIDISSVENGTGKINFGKKIMTNEAPSRARRLVKKSDILLSTVRPNLKAFALIKELPEKVIASTGFAVLRAEKKVLPEYLYAIICDNRTVNKMVNQMEKGAYPSINQSDIEILKIPLPPLEIQEQIVAELDGYQRIIDGARAVVENYKPTMKIDPGWEMVELGEVCDLQNGYAFKSDDYIDNSSVLNFRMSNIRPGGTVDIEYSKKFLPDLYAEIYKEYLLEDGDVVIAMTDMASDPKILAVPCIVKKIDYKLLLNQRVGRFIKIDFQKIGKDYLQVILNQDFIRKTLSAMGGGGVQINLSKKDILKQIIPLPALEIQQSIVGRIKEEQRLVDANRRLIEIYEGKIKEKMDEVWGVK